MKHADRELPSEKIADFMRFFEDCRREHKEALENVKQEEAKLQDFLHAIEFSEDRNERNRLVTKLQASRVRRRQNKDRAMELEYIVNFCADSANRKTINSLPQLLGNQRKREEFLHGERHYNQRTGEL